MILIAGAPGRAGATDERRACSFQRAKRRAAPSPLDLGARSASPPPRRAAGRAAGRLLAAVRRSVPPSGTPGRGGDPPICVSLAKFDTRACRPPLRTAPNRLGTVPSSGEASFRAKGGVLYSARCSQVPEHVTRCPLNRSKALPRTSLRSRRRTAEPSVSGSNSFETDCQPSIWNWSPCSKPSMGWVMDTPTRSWRMFWPQQRLDGLGCQIARTVHAPR